MTVLHSFPVLLNGINEFLACLAGALPVIAFPMALTPVQKRDPLQPTAILTALFAMVTLVRLWVPSQPFFDEVHYVPAARSLLEGDIYANREHPLFGKQMIALGMMIFGDNALGWRIMPWLAGALALFAMMRAMWFASIQRFATGVFGLLVATGFMLFIHARIAMLDIFMMAAISVAAWQFAAALREPESARRRLAICGVALGLAMASKWNVLLLAMVPGIAFFIGRVSSGRERLWRSERGGPIPGVSLIYAAVWLGVVPLIIYAVTFLPALLHKDSQLASQGFIGLHIEILQLQAQTLKPHPYQSIWPQWLVNWRGVWYLYENVDEAQRGVLLIGNPLTMLLGVPAMIWCGLSGYHERDWTKRGIATGFLVSMALWLVPFKSVQFYYHYLLPSGFLFAALALAMEELWKGGNKALVVTVLMAAIGLFVYFFPILSAAPLSAPDAFQNYAWLPSWV
jgi:dolichyl-phosphate-mannose--protein O-mannosyl transferase